ncbi:MAG TPA: AAA family ATPase, partial [Thermoanaerobaculia bacterium]
ALAGQRSRALTQYAELSRLLREELGVEPLKETRQLYESILSEAAKEEIVADPEEPVGPIVPLAGRTGAYVRLLEGWSQALAGRVHLTVVTGARGIGKTRLIKTFLDVTTAKQTCGVLKGRCYELSPLQAYRPFVEVLRGALAEAAEGSGQVLGLVQQEVLEDLARLVPEIRDLRPDLAEPATLAKRDHLFASVRLFLESLCRSDEPLILFLDDLHLADRDTLALLGFLVSELTGPIWIVAAFRPDGEMEEDHPLSRLLHRAEREGRLTRLELEPLVLPMLEDIAESLVGEDQAAELAGFLAEKAAGLPLAVNEIINYLWDEGVLVAQEAGRWKLARALREVEVPEDLDELIRLRIRRLPNSTRRLASLAAILGQIFEVQLLQEAADEHAKVVEIGLEILLKRWLIRHFAYFWTDGRGDEEPLAAWTRGARRGSFEFAHNRTRRAIYEELNPLRRQAMHAQIAASLEKLRGGRDCEALAFHYTVANQWEKALPHLQRSIERALAVGAEEAARRYCDQAIEGLSRLAAGARSEAAAGRWREERDVMRERVAKLWP